MGLRELALASQVGLAVEEERIQILPECRRLCEEFSLDPLGTIASGALLLTLPSEDADQLVGALRSEEIPAAVIGCVVQKEKGVRLESRGRAKDLPQFPRDEIAKLFAK